MVLVDTSIWIDYFNGVENKKTDYLSSLIINNKVCICPVIIQEILQGIKSDRKFELLKSDLQALHLLVYDIVEASVGAAGIYRKGRKLGLTIRKSNDCLIAWYALKASIQLLTNDRDFEQIATFTNLQLTS